MKRSLLILLLGMLIVLAAAALFIDSQGSFSLLYEGKRLAGLFAMILVSFQLLLASRLPLLERGFGQDHLIAFHRTTGIAVLIIALLHGSFDVIFQLTVYGGLALYLPGDLAKLIGILSLLLIIGIAVPAIIRRVISISYDTWRRFHRISFFVVPLVLIHAFLLGTTIRFQPIAMGLWIVCVVIYSMAVGYRLITWINKNRDPYLVDAVQRETHDIVSISLSGKRKDFLPGQFMFIQLKRGKDKSPEHPFTISAPPSIDHLRFSIKAVGDFTGEEIPDLTVGDEVIIEGPYGWFSHVRFPLTTPLLFIAGGIGITPFLSMLRFLAEHDPDRRVMLIWGNKRPGDVGFLDELAGCKASMKALSVLHVLSDDSEGSDVLSDPWTSGFITRDLLTSRLTDIASWGVMLCGPPIMMKKLIPDLISAGVPRKNVLYERFSL